MSSRKGGIATAALPGHRVRRGPGVSGQHHQPDALPGQAVERLGRRLLDAIAQRQQAEEEPAKKKRESRWGRKRSDGKKKWGKDPEYLAYLERTPELFLRPPRPS